MPNKTELMQLNQWEPEDNFLRADFNQDNAILDAAVGKLVADMTQRPGILWGHYTGSHLAGNGTPQEINIGLRPKVVFSLCNSGELYSTSNGQRVALKLEDNSDPGSIWFTDTGFVVCNVTGSQMNVKPYVYSYLVLY